MKTKSGNARADRRNRWETTLAVLIMWTLCCVVWAPYAHAVEQLRVEQGKSLVLKYPEKIETVSLADDQVADVAAITGDELVVIGKQTGTTSLVVWGASLSHTEYVIKVVRNFSGRQILLEVQIGEVGRNAFHELGFDLLWNNTDLTEGQGQIGSYAGEVRTPSAPLSIGEGVTGLFHFVGRENYVTAVVKALQEKGQIDMLATPKLLSLSGAKASFLSGGEIPIPISQSSSSAAQTISVEWKEYGVRLNFVPTVIDSDLINLTIEPEVSSLDYTNSVVIGGFAIPALLTRRANTTVELHSGEAMFLGGLVSNETVVNHKRVPILGHLPLLGGIFTHKATSMKENELVIIVSPRIVDAASEPLPPLPGVEPRGQKPENDAPAPTEETSEG